MEDPIRFLYASFCCEGCKLITALVWKGKYKKRIITTSVTLSRHVQEVNSRKKLSFFSKISGENLKFKTFPNSVICLVLLI